MELFIVTKEGVYKHDIVGMYWMEAPAIEAAEKAWDRERDCYHVFYILKVVLDTEFLFRVTGERDINKKIERRLERKEEYKDIGKYDWFVVKREIVDQEIKSIHNL